MDGIERYLITDRLLLRPWETADMYDLYEVAKDEEVSVKAGWLAHTSPQYSAKIIEDRLSRPGTYAIVPRTVRRPVGSISLMFGKDANISLSDNEAELGYWIGREHWNRGYVTEAAKALVDYGLDGLGLDAIWCLSRLDNPASMRVQDKCSFEFVRNGTINDPLYGELEMRFTRISRHG